MEKFKLDFNEENIEELIQEIKNNKDAKELIEKLKISDEELSFNLNLFTEYIKDKKSCKDCPSFSCCIHSPKGYRYEITRDEEGFLNNNLRVCDKYVETYARKKNIVFSTFDDEELLDEKNIVQLLGTKLVDFTQNEKTGILKILKNEKISGVYIKQTNSKLRKLATLGLAFYLLGTNKVSICSFPLLVRNMKVEYGKFNQELFDDVSNSEVVILTDVGSESVNNFSRDDVLLSLLDYRIQNNLPTIMINSYELEDLNKIYKLGYNDGLKANLVVEKIKELMR